MYKENNKQIVNNRVNQQKSIRFINLLLSNINPINQKKNTTSNIEISLLHSQISKYFNLDNEDLSNTGPSSGPDAAGSDYKTPTVKQTTRYFNYQHRRRIEKVAEQYGIDPDEVTPKTKWIRKGDIISKYNEKNPPPKPKKPKKKKLPKKILDGDLYDKNLPHSRGKTPPKRFYYPNEVIPRRTGDWRDKPGEPF